MSLLTVQQVAKQLAINVKTVRNLIKDGNLHAVKIGKLWRVAPEDLQLFISRRRT
jgi:excisionase family DNA binding protein